MLDVKELCVTTKNGQELLHQITLQIEVGEAIGLTGQSGAGKTTLLKALLGILGNGCQVNEGDVFIDEQPLWKLNPGKRRKLCGTTLGFIPQNPMTAFDPRIKIKKQISETLKVKMGLPREEAMERAKDLLRELGLSQPERVLDSYPSQLSGGMLQRVTAVLLLALNPKYILADEPTSALDAENRELLLHLLQQQKEKTGILFISHDVDALCTLCSKVHVMEHGKLTEEGTMQELLSHPKRDWTKQYAAANKKVDKEGWSWED
ncbi:MAG TPA: ABC transporter ATP-binding protein [Firmicutes bacterium]|nr:ABC transporter ATP-binding protein [Bacillota bacterium]